VNEDIDQTGNVRLIDSNNKLVGVLPIDEAKRKAVASSLDLVLLNAEATPPVCRLINYS
jgi:translation initiation factor IF-3